MEFVYGNYLIVYYYDNVNITIHIHNKTNDKKYSLSNDTTIKKYKDLDIYINEYILQCFTKQKFLLIDKNSHIVIIFNDYINFTLICKNIVCDTKEESILEKEESILELEMKNKELEMMIKKLDLDIKEQNNIIIEFLDKAISKISEIRDIDYYEYLEHKIHIDTEELYFCDFIDNEIKKGYMLNLKELINIYCHKDGVIKHQSYGKYYGMYRNKEDNIPSNLTIMPSPNEIYDSKEGRKRRLIFEEKVNLSLFNSKIKLDKLGLFNISLDILTIPENLFSITSLYLDNVRLLCTVEKFIEFITSLKKLTHLSIRNCKFFTDHLVTYINDLPELKILWTRNSGISSSSLFREDIIIWEKHDSSF